MGNVGENDLRNYVLLLDMKKIGKDFPEMKREHTLDMSEIYYVKI